MSQPKVTVEQLEVGTGNNAILTYNSLYVAGTGRWVQSADGVLGGMNGTSVIPFDNTTPLITEGTQFGSAPLTITSTHHAHFSFSLTVDADQNNSTVVVAIFRNTVCIGTSIVAIDTAGRAKNMAMQGTDNPGPGTYTYSGRVGVSAAGPTWYVNSTSGGNNLGGTLSSAFMLWEIC